MTPRPPAVSTRWTITVDCASPAGFASWDDWYTAHDVAEAEHDDLAAPADPDGAAPSMSFLRVPEGKDAKNRIHLDLQVSGGRHVPAEQRRDRIVAEVRRPADPEGNEFCVL